MNKIRVANLTNFFNRQIMMYSMGDIKFKKPVSLKKVAYITAFLIMWGLPWFYLLGVPDNPYKFAWMIVLPIVAGNFASRPMFGGKGLIDWLKTLIDYNFKEPKGWLDFNNANTMKIETFYTDSEIWVSRRREIEMLSKDLSQNTALLKPKVSKTKIKRRGKK